MAHLGLRFSLDFPKILNWSRNYAIPNIRTKSSIVAEKYPTFEKKLSQNLKELSCILISRDI